MVAKTLITEMDSTPEQISFANHAGDFSPDASVTLEFDTPTKGELILLDLLNGAAAQSAKIDLGENWAERYSVEAVIEMQIVAATNGEVIEFYWSASPSSTAANANMGGASGVAAAYSGYSSDLATSIRQLIFIGNMVMTDDGVDSIQTAFIGDLYPPHRRGSLIVKNECGQTICHTDDVESHITMSPVVPESQ